MAEEHAYLKPKKEVETKAVKCPSCNGFGTVSYGKKECPGCGGKGWIVIPKTIRSGGEEEDES